MSHCNFLQKAIEYVKQAAQEDQNQNYPESLRLYSLSLEYFITALKYEKNEKRKETIRAKTMEYMERAEQIKNILDKNKKDRPEGSGSSGTASKKKGEGEEDEEDTETQRLRKGLQGVILAEKPNVKWDDVAGLEGAKEALREAVIFPIKFPHFFVGNRKPWRGILLYGPPGTGKSYLAKAVATEAEATFFSVSSADLVSKWLGESEKQVKQLFEMGRENKPSIIFIDEIDSLCSSRNDSESESARRIKTEFLIQMNGVGNSMDGVLVLAATNMPWVLDVGIRRRFEKRIYISLPDANARTKMFEIRLGDTPHSLTNQDFRELGEMTENYTGSDITTVVNEAMMMPLRQVQNATHFKQCVPDENTPGINYDPNKSYWTPCSPGDPNGEPKTWMDIEGECLVPPIVTKSNFVRSVRNTRPTVNKEEIEKHIQFTEEFGQEG